MQKFCNMTSSAKADWLAPAGLIAISVIPVVAGIFRLVQLGGGAEITSDNARFFAAPLPVVLHITCVTIYCVLGAFQFPPRIRRCNPNWHRAGGRIFVPCGLVAALTGLWMTQYYPAANLVGPLPADFDGSFVYAFRVLAGSAMALFLCLGFAAVMRRDIPHHRAWVMRGYALV